jgi:hypothetical protein
MYIDGERKGAGVLEQPKDGVYICRLSAALPGTGLGYIFSSVSSRSLGVFLLSLSWFFYLKVFN